MLVLYQPVKHQILEEELNAYLLRQSTILEDSEVALRLCTVVRNVSAPDRMQTAMRCAIYRTKVTCHKVQGTTRFRAEIESYLSLLIQSPNNHRLF